MVDAPMTHYAGNGKKVSERAKSNRKKKSKKRDKKYSRY